MVRYFTLFSMTKEISLYAGFRPCRRGTFVSAKVPKTIPARARPSREWGKTYHSLPGSSASAPNQNGSGTRSEVQSHLSAQTPLAEKSIRSSSSAAPEGEKKCHAFLFNRHLSSLVKRRILCSVLLLFRESPINQ
jgi:hypothetical protein